MTATYCNNHTQMRGFYSFSPHQVLSESTSSLERSPTQHWWTYTIYSKMAANAQHSSYRRLPYNYICSRKIWQKLNLADYLASARAKIIIELDVWSIRGFIAHAHHWDIQASSFQIHLPRFSERLTFLGIHLKRLQLSSHAKLTLETWPRPPPPPASFSSL